MASKPGSKKQPEKKELTEEEAKEMIESIVTLYQLFNKVLKDGDIAQKAMAINKMQTLQKMMRTEVKEFEEVNGVTMNELEEFIENSKTDLAKEIRGEVQDIFQIFTETRPLIDQAVREIGIKPKKKKRKSKLEKRLRSKD